MAIGAIIPPLCTRYFDMVRPHTEAAFEHDCSLCKYVGTSRILVPPFASKGVFGGGGCFMLARVDFYTCGDDIEHRYYLSRSSSLPGDSEMISNETVDSWSLVDLIRATGGDDDYNYMRMAYKCIRVIDLLDRLDLGYAVIRLADRPVAPFVITLPTLWPHEHEIVRKVTQPMVYAFQGTAKDRAAMRAFDAKIEYALQDRANKFGYLTRWNSGELFTPGSIESDADEFNDCIQ